MLNQKLTNYLITLIFIVSFSVFAEEGGMASGGGKGIVCFNNEVSLQSLLQNNGQILDEHLSKIGAMQVLDLQTAFMHRAIEHSNSIQLDLAKKNENLTDYLTRLINKLTQKFPQIGEAVKKKREQFELNIFWRINPLFQAFDELDVTNHISKYCGLTTFAIQYQELGETFIHIDERLFYHPKNSISSQAVLLLHEYIYAVLRLQSIRNSRPVRHIISEVLKR